MKAVNPFTGELIKEYTNHTSEEADALVAKTRDAFADWKNTTLQERCAIIAQCAKVLREQKESAAQLITDEMGKPISEARAEVEKCAWLCEFYAEKAEEFLAPEVVETDSYHKSYVVYDPMGVIFGVMPWNFPLWQVFRFAVPTLIAGNTCMLKHASNVPGCALLIEKIFRDAGLPQHSFTTLLIGAKEAMRLLEDDVFDGVSLTGSLPAGSAVGEKAGKYIRPLVLELGGSDPFIVLEDADVSKAVETAIKSRYLNAGQSCIGAKRCIVHEAVYDEFVAGYHEKMKQLKVGNPSLDDTQLGPLAKAEFVDELMGFLKDAESKGAHVEYGQEAPESGFFFRPAAISNVTHEMQLWTEEAFGPLATLIKVKNEDEALKVANVTEFGLGAMIFSKDLDRAQALARKVDSGCVAINDMVKSDPRLPFGGTKKSGVGRELSHHTLKEFTNIKTVTVQQ